MPTQHRKHRGYETQRLIAQHLTENGWPYATDAGAGRQGNDILNTPGIAIEVKARTGFNPLEWMRQASKNAGNDIPLVVIRPNGAGPAVIEDWPVMIPLKDVIHLLYKAGYTNAGEHS